VSEFSLISPQQINDELSRHLEDDAALERKAMLGFAYARKHYTMT
jgi:hypothetical protein